jgi:hypothetical protein
MKVLIEYIRTLVISFEFVLIILCAYMGFAQLDALRVLIRYVNINGEPLKYVALLPAGILVWNLALMRKIRFPERDSKKILQNWTGYYKLRVILDVALFYSVLFAVTGASIWITVTLFSPEICVLVLLGSFVGASIVGLSCYDAEIQVNEAFSKQN